MNLEGSVEFRNYLELKYGIDILDIKPVKNVMRIITKEGDRCLKRVRYNRGQFLFIFSAMNYLAGKNFQGILPFIPTRDGNLYIEFGNVFYFMTDWIQCRECNYSNPVELKKATITLAKLHDCSKGFTPVDGSEIRTGWGKWMEKFSKRIEDMNVFKDIIKSKGSLSYFDTKYMENVDYFIEQGHAAVEHLKKTRYIELSLKESEVRSFCHHDYANHNVLISNDLNIYIIDFDYCICDSRLHDLCSLIIRNMRYGNWNMEKAQYIIDCYKDAGHIDEDEIPVMNGFMEFPQDFWQVGLQYYIERQKWDESNFNRRLDRAVNDRQDRELFIENFSNSISV